MNISNSHKSLLAILFALGEPSEIDNISAALEISSEEAKKLIDELQIYLDEIDSPFQILILGNEYQLSTKEQYTQIIKKAFSEKRDTPLSQAALEVLAAVAYNQPVTRAYVEQVRGVDSSGIIISLVEKGLLEEAGRLDLPGRPISYRTTSNFLRTFGLSSLDDLPVVESKDTLEDSFNNGQLTIEDVEV